MPRCLVFVMSTIFGMLLMASVQSVVAAENEVIQKPLPVQAVRAFENLIFERPVVIAHANDGSDRIFVAEQDGIVKVFANDPEVEDTDVFLDIDKRCRYRKNQNRHPPLVQQQNAAHHSPTPTS